jgi:hypothetical protein
LRRAVDLECGVLSDAWHDEAALPATDLSPFGMWLATDLPLATGDAVVLSFKPPRWPAWGSPVVVLAEVVRVGMPRRRGDRGAAGMGLRFVDLDPDHAARMAECLRGLPPTLPAVRARRAERCEEQLVLEDGSSFALRAEGALLGASRPPGTPLAPLAPLAPAAESRAAAALAVHAPRRRGRAAHATRIACPRTPRGAERPRTRRERSASLALAQSSRR